MSETYVERLKLVRDKAVAQATEELARRGFAPQTDGSWVGRAHGSDGPSISVVLPERFPDCVPEIFLAAPDHHDAYAHIERSGKLCLVPPTGILIDTTRPEQIIAESLNRADGILYPTAGSHAEALADEFLSYWPETSKSELFFAIEIPSASGSAVAVKLTGNPARWLIASTVAEAETWAQRVGRGTADTEPAFVIPLSALFQPPRFTTVLTLRVLREIIAQNSTPEFNAEFADWLRDTGAPATIIFIAPLRQGHDFVVFAARVPPLTGALLKKSQNGFRPGRVPKARLVSLANSEPIRRGDVERFDPAYLIARGGGNLELLQKKVIVVGCGSVGSNVAVGLAAAGVGTLKLIDNESLSTANIHRHALGAKYVGRPKVEGLAAHLTERFPHVKVVPDQREILAILGSGDETFTDSDLVVLALGNETIERRLNDSLRELKRLHVWLEPLGLGGHVLITGFQSLPGCFECLFRPDPEHGALNMASLVAPGQVFHRTMGACAGTFTPYGMIDAQRAAVEAVRGAVAVLSGKETRPTLTSWVVSSEQLLADGFRLSARGESIHPGSTHRNSEFSRLDCQVCGGNEE